MTKQKAVYRREDETHGSEKEITYGDIDDFRKLRDTWIKL